MQSTLKSSLTVGALLIAASGLTLAGCASEAPPPPPVAQVAPPPPPPVSLPTHVLEAASNFRGYMRKAEAITGGFSGGAQVEQAVTTAAQYEPHQFSRGAVAYAALVALQEPSFVAGVRSYGVDETGRRALASRLLADPNYVSALPGASAAAGLVVATLNAEGDKLRGVGEQVRLSAYSIQHQSWSIKPVPDAVERLAAAKAASAAPMSPIPADVEEFRLAVGGGEGTNLRVSTVPGAPIPAPFTPVVARGLTLAALAALGQVGDGDDAAADALMTENEGGFCLKMSKLNLYQCLAVAKPYYEDVFCLGKHELIDTGTCVATAVGKPAPTSTPVSLASQTSVSAQLGMSR